MHLLKLLYFSKEEISQGPITRGFSLILLNLLRQSFKELRLTIYFIKSFPRYIEIRFLDEEADAYFLLATEHIRV
jgi:hypothetical protein